MTQRSDLTGALYTSDGDSANIHTTLQSVVESVRGIITVTSAVQRDQIIEAYDLSEDPPTSGRAIYFHRRDRDLIEYYDGTDIRRLTGKSDSSPFAQACDATSLNFNNEDTTSVNVTFPVGRFTVAPIVTSTAGAISLSAGVSGITSSGFTLSMRTLSGTALNGTYLARWQAMQMQPNSAGG